MNEMNKFHGVNLFRKMDKSRVFLKNYLYINIKFSKFCNINLSENERSFIFEQEIF